MLRRAELGVLKSETVSPSISVVEVGVLPFLGLKRSRMLDGDFEHPTRRGLDEQHNHMLFFSGQQYLFLKEFRRASSEQDDGGGFL